VKDCGCGGVVQVILYGFGGDLTYGKGSPEERRIGFVDKKNRTAPIRKTLIQIGLSALLPFNGKRAAHRASELLDSLMGHLRMDEEGRSIEPLSNPWKLDSAQDHQLRPQYQFDYDWRIGPFEAATQLNAFIEALCESTDHTKIALTGFSEGSAVAMAYLKEYGSARLETLILANGAWQGLTLAGELLTRRIGMAGARHTSFLLELLRPLVWGAMKYKIGPFYEQALLPLFAHMPAFWAFVPPDDYAQARARFAGQEKYEKLLAKADKYHDEVQLKAEELLRQARANSVKIAIVCGYGHPSIPVTKAKTYHTDTLIDTARASGGAAVARYGRKLSRSDSPYLSQDRIIDAATCMFPDYTWFIRGMRHEDGPSEALRKWVIESAGQVTVFDDTRFPQFMQLCPTKAITSAR
jgi:pimeloyl-ACP methyl ester carboxylesterase